MKSVSVHLRSPSGKGAAHRHPTKEERIRQARLVIGNKADIELISEIIEFYDALIPVSADEGRYPVRSRKQKDALIRLGTRVAGLLAALKQTELIPEARDDCPIKIEQLIDYYKAILQASEARLENQGGYNLRKRHSIDLAADLCEIHGIPLKASRTGTFCRLASIISGNGPHHGADFYQLCREHLGKTQA